MGLAEGHGIAGQAPWFESGLSKSFLLQPAAV